MIRRLLLAMVALLLTAAPAAAVGPPDETLERATAALGVLDGRGFVGSYVLSVDVDVSAPGDNDEDSHEVQEVTVHPDGTQTTRLIRKVEGGRDVTAEQTSRTRVEKNEHDNHGEVDIELLPLGKRAGLYTFSRPKLDDGVMVARFRPAHDARFVPEDDDDFLTRGELAWDPDTLDPLWIQMRPDDKPPFVSKLDLRFEFSRDNGVLYPSRVETSTRAGIPLLLRVKVDVVIEVRDVRPSDSPALATLLD